jgi:hypothetical protein
MTAVYDEEEQQHPTSNETDSEIGSSLLKYKEMKKIVRDKKEDFACPFTKSTEFDNIKSEEKQENKLNRVIEKKNNSFLIEYLDKVAIKSKIIMIIVSASIHRVFSHIR